MVKPHYFETKAYTIEIKEMDTGAPILFTRADLSQVDMRSLIIEICDRLALPHPQMRLDE